MKRKPLILTPEERKQHNLEVLRKRAERKKAKHDKLIDVEDMKRSHDWVQSKTYNITKTSVTYTIGNCRRCGAHYQLFKANPVMCPRAKTRNQKNNSVLDLDF